jgi:hypothetical protein
MDGHFVHKLLSVAATAYRSVSEVDNNNNKRRRLVEFKDGCRYGRCLVFLFALIYLPGRSGG